MCCNSVTAHFVVGTNCRCTRQNVPTSTAHFVADDGDKMCQRQNVPATKCDKKMTHFVAGDKMCSGDKMCRNKVYFLWTIDAYLFCKYM